MIRAYAVLVALAFVPSLCAGQTPASESADTLPQGVAAPSIEATVEALARTIESQQKLLEEQGRQIEQLRREIAEARGVTRPAPATEARPHHRILRKQAASQPPAAGDQSGHGSEVPPDVVTAEDFPAHSSCRAATPRSRSAASCA